ncbi:hypothetical protein OAC57_05705 [Planktomarina temperata]|nr:hypothetical protein [Planktomarina temperata]
MKNRTTLISFANKEYKTSQATLSMSAKKYQVFDSIIEYGEDDVQSLFTEYETIMREPRGYGLWLWKPYLVCQSLKDLNYGDILFYCDSGVEFVRNPSALLELVKQSDVVTFELDFVEKFWSHQALVNNFPCDKVTETYMRAASYFIIQKSENSEKFIHDWFKLCTNSVFLKDDFISPQIHGFNFHRHDQSIFSCLSKSQGYEFLAYRDPSQFGLKYTNDYPNSPYPQIINHHRKNSKRLKSAYYKKILPYLRKALKY